MSTSGSTEAYTRSELCAFLNRMLEAERAGAKALLVYMEEHERQGESWKALRRVQADEAHDCALLGKLLERHGEPYSHATGEFYEKAVAVAGRRQRIEFLMRGLGWAVREFDRALPRIGDDADRSTIRAMRESHAHSIEACAAVARGLKD